MLHLVCLRAVGGFRHQSPFAVGRESWTDPPPFPRPYPLVARQLLKCAHARECAGGWERGGIRPAYSSPFPRTGNRPHPQSEG